MHLLIVEDDERLAGSSSGCSKKTATSSTSPTTARRAPRSPRTRPGSTSSSSTSACPTSPASTSRDDSAATQPDARDPHAHRPRHRRRPGHRPRRGRRRLPRQALRVRGARGPSPRAVPPGGRAQRAPEPVLAVGPISLDETSRRVTAGGRDVDLSPREFSLLECLLRHPGQTLTRDQLLDQAWPFSVAVTPNAVDAYVHYLRDEARRGRAPDRDRSRRRLPAERCLTASRVRAPMTPPSSEALAADGRLIRRVRWRLVAWSGLSTLAGPRRPGRGALLHRRANARVAATQAARQPDRPAAASIRPDVDEPGLGFIFGGAGSGHVRAWFSTADGEAVGRRPLPIPDGPADPRRRSTHATKSTRDVRLATVRDDAVPGPDRADRDEHRRRSTSRSIQRPDGRADHPQRDAPRPALRRRRGRPRRARLRGGLCPAGPRADPRVARRPAAGAPPPARVRGRRES